MEDKKPLDQTQPTPATPVQPVAFPNTPTDPAVMQEPKTASLESGQTPNEQVLSSGNKSNINIWIAVAVIVLVIILAAGYFYLSQTSKNEPTPTPKPASQEQQEGDMEAELNSLDVESEGTDFAEVDKDLQSL